MAGRVKRKAALAAIDHAACAVSEARASCALCGRPLGMRTEWHHVVPRSEGGRETVPLHPICHRALHATLSNRELARRYADPGRLRAHPDLARFVEWVADKPADFHAPTRRSQSKR